MLVTVDPWIKDPSSDLLRRLFLTGSVFVFFLANSEFKLLNRTGLVRFWDFILDGQLLERERRGMYRRLVSEKLRSEGTFICRFLPVRKFLSEVVPFLFFFVLP